MPSWRNDYSCNMFAYFNCCLTSIKEATSSCPVHEVCFALFPSSNARLQQNNRLFCVSPSLVFLVGRGKWWFNEPKHAFWYVVPSLFFACSPLASLGSVSEIVCKHRCLIAFCTLVHDITDSCYTCRLSPSIVPATSWINIKWLGYCLEVLKRRARIGVDQVFGVCDNHAPAPWCAVETIPKESLRATCRQRIALRHKGLVSHMYSMTARFSREDASHVSFTKYSRH